MVKMIETGPAATLKGLRRFFSLTGLLRSWRGLRQRREVQREKGEERGCRDRTLRADNITEKLMKSWQSRVRR